MSQQCHRLGFLVHQIAYARFSQHVFHMHACMRMYCIRHVCILYATNVYTCKYLCYIYIRCIIYQCKFRDIHRYTIYILIYISYVHRYIPGFMGISAPKPLSRLSRSGFCRGADDKFFGPKAEMSSGLHGQRGIFCGGHHGFTLW